MLKRAKDTLCIVTITAGVSVFLSFTFFYSASVKLGKMYLLPAGKSLCELQCQKSEEERNNISVILNQKLETLAQMICDKGAYTSKGGAYCARGKWAHGTDQHLAEFLKKFFKGKRIGSFGEGLGHYKRILDPFCAVYDGYDGAPYTMKDTGGRVKFLDLSVPQYGLPTYDYIISLEVGEHIPQQFEQTYFDNLARYAKEGIIMSWSEPGQRGYGHVNNRPPEYVEKQLADRGFLMDRNVSHTLRAASNSTHFVKHVSFFYRGVRV